ncbi:MAG TPA: multicopper oxidase domain-containing protein, partial [Thermoleophilia bacterium]|nr:multicopper oxidase domain-containing protein [Thermoleophilia bacterium]
MAARAIRHFSLTKASILVFVLVAILTALFMVKISQGEAAPSSPTDATAVPHYFGPWPNWALSPLTLPDATVTIGGNGTGAAATAAVGANGAITDLTLTSPGEGYTTGASVSITSDTGTGASASATVTLSGVISSVALTDSGAGYTEPTVAFTGGGASTAATATAYGGVDAVALGDPGSGYTFPTVDFDMPDDPNGTIAKAHAEFDQQTGEITAIVVDDPGSGYLAAPGVVVRDGTLMDPILSEGTSATATATLKVLSVTLDTYGAGYTSDPTITFDDAAGSGSGAAATATRDNGSVTSLHLTAGGSGYISGGGIKKFQDQLPMLCDPSVDASCPDWNTDPDAKYLPVGVPVETTYDEPNGQRIKSDEYEIGLVQYRTKFNSDLPATLVRGYVQLETPAFVEDHPGVSQHYPLYNADLQDRTSPGERVLIDGQPAFAVTPPQWLGPVITATKNKPVRIVFRNLLPKDQPGDLFLPVDSTLMGSGMGPMGQPLETDQGSVTDLIRNPPCTESPKPNDCFKDDRATLHLHGGITPWISDGTPHQWITPANEDTPWPEGVDVRNVPDMDVGLDPTDGVQTFYYTNQQSARFMFYHDHAWGITRLNVYAGEAAGYLIADETEQALVDSSTIPGPADTIPLVIQDRTFVPQDSQLYDQHNDPENPDAITSYGQDPTWDQDRWGSYGDSWYHHVYMPAQNPGDASGMSAYGRWMYGPWFWPPAADTAYGPIDNPYYDSDCDLDDPATWQYQTDPYCEPSQIPGTPNISAGMEQFNDTPTVNGVAYPEVTLQPKSYRFRILNAANDRSFNLQWYIADPSTGTNSEVALDPQLLAAAQTDPNVFPTPVDANNDAAGPDWIHIGSEGGFLPAPTVTDGQQPTTWITDPTRFDVGNVDLHSMALAPAERSDVIVDFSAFAGRTLIMYNDAPAAWPARVASYDYYTGAADLSPNGAPTILPGYGPNTRTVMRVKIAAAAPAAAFNLNKLKKAFSHKADGSGVFESGQHPVIVGQAAYNSAYGTSFPAASNCNPVPNELNPAFQICDGLVRVNDTLTFGFNTLKKPKAKTILDLQPKAIHDEMNATTFDEFGRMQANLGVEAQPPTPGAQNGTFYPFVNPATELVNAQDLPKNAVTYDANGNAVSDITIAPLSNPNDGTQMWRITHNGVDTHPIHFHLYDVQMINRVSWDNIILKTEPGELGWKDTIRVSPLQDTIVALRPIIPDVPWEVPNSVRNLNPMDPTGSTNLFNSVDPQGNPTAPIVNQLVNFGWQYVWHCHILSHEEMDMMRPQSVALPPVAATGLAFEIVDGHVVLTFNDNSIAETSYVVQRNDGTGWVDAGTIDVPLTVEGDPHQVRTFTDPAAYDPALVYDYRVAARNTVGYVADSAYPSVTAQSVSEAALTGDPPADPTGLTATAEVGPQVALSFTDNAIDETGFTLQRAVNGGTWAALTTLPANTNVDPGATGTVTYNDTGLTAGDTYDYRVRADKGAAASGWSNTASATAAWTITPSAGANGSITPSTATSVLPGADQAFTIAPDAGYHILDVKVDDVSNPAAVTAGSYTFTNVTTDHTISATFETLAPAITVTIPNGSELWTTASTQNLG